MLLFISFFVQRLLQILFIDLKEAILQYFEKSSRILHRILCVSSSVKINGTIDDVRCKNVKADKNDSSCKLLKLR